jgi:lipase chaperone LimK
MNKSMKWGVVLTSIILFSFILKFQLFQNNDTVPDSLTNSFKTQDHQIKVGDSTLPLSKQNTVPSNDVLGYNSKFGPLPDSLEGTVMANALVVDEEGNLRISSDIRRVFDYFLSTSNEEPLDVIFSRINEYLEHHLEQPALSQAKDILAGYIDLKKALYDFQIERAELIKQNLDDGHFTGNKLLLLEEQLLARNELREKFLSEDVYDAFYADEQVFDQYTLDRMKVTSNQLLTENEKQALLLELDNEAPEELVQARNETQISDTLKNRTAMLREQGADDNEIRALRAEMFGEEAAVRFDELDKKRAEWKHRLNQYMTKRSQILSSEGISKEDRQSQINILRANEFDDRESIRVKVFERQADAS